MAFLKGQSHSIVVFDGYENVFERKDYFVKYLMKMLSSYETVEELSDWHTQFYFFVACILVVLYLISWLQQSSRTWKMGMKIPGPTPLPFFGNALMALAMSNKGTL